ncbi:ThiF family adenylyltransferase [Nitrososphaera sp. AFS]|jgi:adenylyltransferase/sulfurtransferase|uniref:ThiF family adenylyltransferase n=1 Tax=Nitrososphaera sp. AFS TaxID=2301191 RepID=UPI00139224FC|nr:ThiF family adenylyltransferase [Nitrososphaera sp. AFS]NAL77418.1 4-methyl-5(B-hydroxyethyl)-thiazole monophosphate biosynthesis protein [Nitrososphaera sp. AFS]
MANVEFVIPSVLNKGMGEKKISLEARDLSEAFLKVSDILGDDFKRRIFDLNGKPRSLINIYVNGKNMRFSSDGMSALLKDGDSLYILPAVAGGADLTNEDTQRYSRQIMLDEIGFIGMEKLRSAKICVVGTGGIGNPVVTQLTAMGVGKLTIVDRDVIEISNLHRQHLYNQGDLGKVKVEVAAERLKRINPHVEIEAVPVSITKYTAESVVRGMDLVIDALDSVDARYALNDACIKNNIPFIYGGALGMLGSVCTILPNKSACLRCMFPALTEDDMPTCSTEGVHPSILYLVAGTQVSEAVRVILGQKPKLIDRLLYIDLNELSFDKIQMSRQEQCPSCGQKEDKNVDLVPQQEEVIIEELCGRERGRRAYSVTPTSTLSNSISLAGIAKNAETLGYDIKMKGKLGITAISATASKLSISFLRSGAATIVGAKDEHDAMSIYREFAKSSD